MLTIDAERLTEDELDLIMRIAVAHPPIRAGSAECDAEFVAYWSLGSVDGLYRRKNHVRKPSC